MPEKLGPLTAMLPYAQLVLLGGVTWVLHELVVRQGAAEVERARAFFQERLDKAYGPINHVIGEILYQLHAGGSLTAEREHELRELLRTHGHQLRPEHYQFGARLLAGWRPSTSEAFWHRQSMTTEIEKLKYLVYGPSSAAEVALTPRAITVVRRWVSRTLNYLLAVAVWVVLFVALVWVAFHAGEGALRWIWPAGITIVSLAVVRELVAIGAFRRRFSNNVLKKARRGDKGDKVRVFQVLLELCGYGVGPCGTDGVFGADTEVALLRFQKAQGLKSTGELDENTRVRLFSVARRS